MKFVDLLQQTGKTIYQVSKETGIAQTVLSDWKNGRGKPKFDKLLLLAKYFGVPVEYFADNEGNLDSGIKMVFTPKTKEDGSIEVIASVKLTDRAK